MTVDSIYRTKLTMGGRYHELNINTGLFLGQISPQSDIFVGNYQPYRGCLRFVTFNSLDVMLTAYQQQELNSRSVFAVTNNCAREFGVEMSRAMQFLSNDSFVAFPSLQARQGGTVSFEIRTFSALALLLYNAAMSPSVDLFAIEITNGHIRAAVNRGSGTVYLTSERTANDGQWHQVSLVLEVVSYNC